MKVVLDTNVLVSAIFKPFNPPGKIVSMASSGLLTLCFDFRIMTEYREVLERPELGFSKVQINALLEEFESSGERVVGEPLSKRLIDPKDEAFLEVAIAGNVQCLITGNLKHFPSSPYQGIKILSPAQFLDFYRQSK